MPQSKLKFWAAVASLFIAAIACNFSVSTAKLQNVRLASDKEGASPTTTFGQQDTIYLLGELANAPSDTKLKTTWVAVDAQGTDANTVIDEADLTSGDGTFSFYLQNNQALWPPGKYRVDLYMNDKLSQSFDYQVEQTAQPAFKDLYLSTEGQDASTTSFNPEDIWALNGELVDAPSGASPRAVWSAVRVSGELQNGVIDQQEQPIDGGKFSVPYHTDRAAWPAGQYSVDVYLDGVLTKTIAFEVAGGQAVTAENVRTATDENGDNPTTVFSPQDVFYLVADVSNAPSGGIAVKVIWTAVQIEGGSADNGVINTYTGNADNGSFWSSLASNSGAWQPGQYRVDFYLDDQLVQTIDFEVAQSGSATPPPSSSDASLETIYLARDADGNDDTNVFAPTDSFYLFGTLVNAPQGGQVEAVWTAVDAQGYNPNDTISKPETFDVKEGDFSISLDEGGTPWVLGTYKVDLMLNGQEIDYREFMVTDIQIQKPQMALDQNGSQLTSTYATTDPFYLIFDLNNAPDGTKITTKWYHLGATSDLDVKLSDTDHTFNSGSYYVSLTSDNNTWASGDYEVDLYLNGYYDTAVFFSVK